LLCNTAIGEATARDVDESVDDGGIKKLLEITLYYDERVANLANRSHFFHIKRKRYFVEYHTNYNSTGLVTAVAITNCIRSAASDLHNVSEPQSNSTTPAKCM
jgi:hypothetical protein